MDIKQVIIKPYFTEKTNMIKSNSERQVITFLVDKKANKHQIKNAFYAIYQIEAEKINIVNKKSTRTRTGTLKPGYTKAKKVAYITLPLGKQIAFTQEEAQEAKVEENTEEKK